MANLFVNIFMFVMLWVILAPLTLMVYLINLPVKLLRKVMGREIEPWKPELEVQVTESELKPPKDELFFIHGYPDSGALWDKQVQFLKSEYRCIVVTLPNFGKKANPSSWGVDFPEMIPMLAKAIEQHSSKKQVSLIIHDWGSLIGFFLYKSRPDLISRIATLDIGGDFSNDFLTQWFYYTYQLFFVFLFLIGSPIGDTVFQITNTEIKHRPNNELRVQMAYPYYYYYFSPKKQKGIPVQLDAARCPIYYGYGISKMKKFISFHSDKWLKQLKENEVHGCKVVEFETDHFIMVEAPDKLNESLKQWFEDTAEAVHRKPHMPTGIGIKMKK